MKQKIMLALGHFATVSDMDTLGYLGSEELAAAQRARLDSAGQQQRLAAEYLHKCRDSQLAKQKLRRDIAEIEADTVDGKFSDEEANLFERFATELDLEIDRLSQKSESYRAALRLFHKVPTQIWVLSFIATVVVVAALIAKMFKA
ncbi:hypothetical protein [Sphingopyxis solisilvae]|uniref:hypothetical protein n=1 Tax=Sphingopyxis solisilvae TaxID=1886788 RepID=UPI001892C01E|nr:hypothetical protein [Sphingopyxis solisilvae]